MAAFRRSRMLERFPFWGRAALLAGLMLVGAAVDFWRKGRSATRHKEYGFIWLTGLVGCLFGGVNDFITSSISPDYFQTGKGLLGGDGFHARAVLYGIKEGLSAGVIAGAICIYVARQKSKHPPLPFAQLLAMLWLPAICAVAGAALLPMFVGGWDPTKLAMRLAEVNEDPVKIPAFLRVWWIHTGLYAGALAGLCVLLARVIAKRRKLPATTPAAA